MAILKPEEMKRQQYTVRGIPGWESSYGVTENGIIMRKAREGYNPEDPSKPITIRAKPINSYKDAGGYDYVILTELDEEGNRRQKCLVHRAVAIAFIPNPDNLERVYHLDGNKSNNDISNLAWTARQ